ncbi:hypothetical protein [Azorhizobium sp. AG788]|uniref:hypothetical protein n=1 Tax=Azorhizobium sp. AG788 TaxID=2183897 RepID=UPI00313939EB
MATFTVAAATDWISVLALGSVGDRWRLDDYDIFAEVKAPGDDEVLIDMSLANGRLIISDPVSRRLEINVGWALIEPLASVFPASFEFDFMFVNRTTEVRWRGETHTLLITRGITFPEA